MLNQIPLISPSNVIDLTVVLPELSDAYIKYEFMGAEEEAENDVLF